MSDRLDRRLREWGLVASRARGQELIRSGAVEVKTAQGWRVVRDGSFSVEGLTAADIRISRESEVLRFVSRGGRKLEAALEHLGIDITGSRALDVGVSTGGFSDCLLQRGAREIVAVDVGHQQLAEKLRRDPRLKLYEGVNARQLSADPAVRPALKEPFDLIVVDLSFISLTLVIAELRPLLAPLGRLLALVKPQFELSRDDLNRRGVVEDPKLHEIVRQKILACAVASGLDVLDYFSSVLPGQDGNQEYFLYARPHV